MDTFFIYPRQEKNGVSLGKTSPFLGNTFYLPFRNGAVVIAPYGIFPVMAFQSDFTDSVFVHLNAQPGAFWNIHKAVFILENRGIL